MTRPAMPPSVRPSVRGVLLFILKAVAALSCLCSQAERVRGASLSWALVPIVLGFM